MYHKNKNVCITKILPFKSTEALVVFLNVVILFRTAFINLSLILN